MNTRARTLLAAALVLGFAMRPHRSGRPGERPHGPVTRDRRAHAPGPGR